MQVVKLKEVMKYRNQFIEVDDEEVYRRCRVQLHCRGVVQRDKVLGSAIKTKKQRVCITNDFIVAEMDAKFGGYGIIPPALNGAVVSSHYYLYEINKEKLFPDYLEVIIDSGHLQEQIKAVGSTNYSRISAKEVLEYEIPCPELAIQKEIIGLYGKCKSTNLELKHELTHQQTLLKKLRQQILQEAIEGKLTADWREQNPDAEPASELLKRIAAEKAQLVKDKKIKAQKPLPSIPDAEKLFELPQGWAWCRLEEVTLVYEAGKSFKCEDRAVNGKEWGVIKTSAITSSCFNENENKFYQDDEPEGVLKVILRGDLIFCRASGSKGLAGKSCIVNNISKNLLLSDKTPRLILSSFVYKSFVFFHNETKHTSTYYSSLNIGKSTSMNNITKDQLLNKMLPLPPFYEQQAIVTKVEKLLVLCDQLETQITQNQAHAEQLMQAVLKEAFGHNREAVLRSV